MSDLATYIELGFRHIVDIKGARTTFCSCSRWRPSIAFGIGASACGSRRRSPSGIR